MGEIEIRSEVRNLGISIPRLKGAARKILNLLHLSQASLSVLLVDDRKIRRLNRRYLAHNRPTDVIAFGQLPGPLPKRGRFLLGDIVISVPTAKRQAPRYGNPLFYEICFYLCHGILHLLGWKDKSKKEAFKMRRKQEAVLKHIGIS